MSDDLTSRARQALENARERGLSLAEIGEICNVSKQYLSAFLHGGIKSPSVKKMEAILKLAK